MDQRLRVACEVRKPTSWYLRRSRLLCAACCFAVPAAVSAALLDLHGSEDVPSLKKRKMELLSLTNMTNLLHDGKEKKKRKKTA